MTTAGNKINSKKIISNIEVGSVSVDTNRGRIAKSFGTPDLEVIVNLSSSNRV